MIDTNWLAVAEIAGEAPPLWRVAREIFGNVPPAAKFVFYVLSAVAVGVLVWGTLRRARLWKLGREAAATPSWKVVAGRFVREILLLERLRGRRKADRAHALLFGGFVVLFIGTTLIAIEHGLAAALGREADNPVFHRGVYYIVFEIAMDVAGVALLAGCWLFAVRRIRGKGSFARTNADWGVLLGLVAIGITGFVLEGLRIVSQPTELPGVSPVGFLLGRCFVAAGVTRDSALLLHLIGWWGHAVLALALIAAFPFTRLFHAIAGAAHLMIRDASLGTMSLVSMEEVEQTGKIGVGDLGDFTRGQLLEFDACVSCGRCQDACPAFEAGKPLSPRNIVQDLRRHLDGIGPPAVGNPAANEWPTLHGDVIDAAALWACTTCSACATVCPLGISPVRMITDMRRHLVGMGEFRGSAATSLQKTQRSGNPWGLPAAERFDWAQGLDVPTVDAFPDFEILYWVGCAASYDRRVQKVARSVARLLTAAGVRFAVLGPKERCTGESARRLGDEFLFQELAESNVQSLAEARVKKIVTHCPHCLNSLRQDYPQLGGHYEVVHHSELLAELIAAGKLSGPASRDPSGPAITYHDPCYLARVNAIVDAPREVLQAATADASGESLREVPRCGSNTACCGAGGGRMWFDDPAGERIGSSRIEELRATGAETVAVSCPFCLIMVGDGMQAAAEPAAQPIEVRDIAEILADQLPDGGD